MSAPSVTLRPYRVEDEERAVAIWWDSWHSIRPGLRHPHPIGEWRRRWASEIVPAQTIVVAEDGGRLVGFAAADLAGRELSQIFVAPDVKRRGVGGVLFAWAQRLMADGFILHTLVDNAASRAFYERHGMVAGECHINPANGLETIDYHWTPASAPAR